MLLIFAVMNKLTMVWFGFFREHAKMLMKLRDSASESTLSAVFKKYSVSENAEVALLPSLEDLTVSCS